MTPLGRRLVVRARGVLAGRDDREVRPLVPGGEHALDELAVHVELACGPRTAARASRPRSRRRRARRARSAAISSRVLHHPDRRHDHVGARTNACAAARAGDRARSAPTCGRRSRRDRARARRARRRARSGRRSPPTARSRTGRAAASTRGASSRGTTSCASPVARQHEHREPLERHRLVAGEVRQVGADREQQHVDAELGHARARPRDPRDGDGSRVDARAGRRCSRAFFARPVRRRCRRRPSRSAQSSRRSRSPTRSISGTAYPHDVVTRSTATSMIDRRPGQLGEVAARARRTRASRARARCPCRRCARCAGCR